MSEDASMSAHRTELGEQVDGPVVFLHHGHHARVIHQVRLSNTFTQIDSRIVRARDSVCGRFVDR